MAISPIINGSNIPIESRMIIYSHFQKYITYQHEQIQKMETRIRNLETRFDIRNGNHSGNWEDNRGYWLMDDDNYVDQCEKK